jgi:fermentation-respiration switch protein FrsA (DUF1100 family)
VRVSGRGLSSSAIAAAAIALAGAWAPAAGAAPVASALGIPCKAEGGVQHCEGSIPTRVRSFDGVPLDVNVTLPSADSTGPWPLVVLRHGFAQSKGSEGGADDFAHQGYAVLDYSARGFGDSCGSVPSRLADPSGCAEGWIHMDDARYEARDTQHLAGLLADEGLIDPRGIGVTGTSYGGIQSFLLATLRNRVMLPDGRLVPWTSPAGKPMQIAAAVPRWGWTVFPEALVPAGNDLDYLVNNPYGSRIGIPKLSYFNFLYPLGAATGYYAPPGVDFESDITGYYQRAIVGGEPYDGEPLMERIIREANLYHSSYYVERAARAAGRGAPAPIFAYNAWTDDLNPPDEALRYLNLIRARYPRVEASALFAAGAGHPRAGLTAATPEYDALRMSFFARYLKGGRAERARRQWIGFRTFTQACGGGRVEGPFHTASWRAQRGGEVRYQNPRAFSFDGTGGSPATSAAVDPVAATANNGCITIPRSDETNAASYELRAARGKGYLMIGAPTIVARIAASDQNAQIQARLWDVASDGRQTLVTHGAYRPRLDRRRRQVFQLNPNGWRFAAGHRAKLELLGRDAPYGRPSNGSFTVRVSRLELRLPVRDRPGSTPGVKRPRPFLGRNGRPAPRRSLVPR